jgi:hypothetical protein
MRLVAPVVKCPAVACRVGGEFNALQVKKQAAQHQSMAEWAFLVVEWPG